MRTIEIDGDEYVAVHELGNMSCAGCAFDYKPSEPERDRLMTGCRILDADGAVGRVDCDAGDGREQVIWLWVGKKES